MDPQRLRAALKQASEVLLAERNPAGHWVGELSSSALSTATAIVALAVMARERAPVGAGVEAQIARGRRWLRQHQNADGGWGDTVRSLSNLSTTTLCWAALGAGPMGKDEDDCQDGLAGAERWLKEHAGGLDPDTLGPAIIARYGKDRTFSVPILTMCALAGRMGQGRAAWRHVLPLPFELAVFPHRFFAALKLPVVSYALPALIAIGQARHWHRPSRNPCTRLVRQLARNRTLRVLDRIQPDNGGFLEATPLTSFVTMSLAGSGLASHPVAQRGLGFLRQAQREDGSWPIDTNLATWVTTLAINALGCCGFDPGSRAGPPEMASLLPAQPPSWAPLARWLLGQQYRVLHPYTQAAPGGWAWTDLPGGVPDADDTCGALLALESLRARPREDPDMEREPVAPDLTVSIDEAQRAGARWLLGLQNRDGGFPTFCRGWGALPFDRSSPDITAHAVRVLQLHGVGHRGDLTKEWQSSRARALEFLVRSQQPDGSWIPLWFGNQHAPDESNRVYGTSRVLLGLHGFEPDSPAAIAFARGLTWLAAAQLPDGSWGGDGRTGSVEETGLALETLAGVTPNDGTGAEQVRARIERGCEFLVAAVERGAWREPAPIGFYFARLWYFERLYPMIFTVSALRNAAAWLGVTRPE